MGRQQNYNSSYEVRNQKSPVSPKPSAVIGRTNTCQDLGESEPPTPFKEL